MHSVPGPSKLCFELPARKPLGFRQQAFALRALASQFPRPADGFGLLARLALGGLLEMVAAFHLPEETFALHLLLERLQRLVDVVVADNDLNDLKLSIGLPATLDRNGVRVECRNAEKALTASVGGYAGPFDG